MKKKLYILVLILVVLFFSDRVYAYESYKVGYKVTYNGEDYYVIADSNENQNYVTLLKEKPLTAEEVNKYNGGEYISKDGEMPYYLGCDTISVACTNNYDESSAKMVVDSWANDLNDLVEMNGYKARLITTDELVENLEYLPKVDASGDPIYESTKTTPTWVSDNNYSYWTMSECGDDNYTVTGIGRGDTNKVIVFDKSKIRPVINLNKNVLDCKNGNKYKTERVKRYNKFKIGDEITYKGEKYYVIQNSTSISKTLTLLKAEPLTSDEINKYKGNLDFTSENNGMPYYKSNACDDKDNITGCINDYNQSYVKQVIDKWSSNFDDLVEIDGYKTRLLNEEDLYRLGYERKTVVITVDNLCKTEDTPEWVYNNDYWIMYGIEDSNNVYEITKKECIYVESSTYQEFYKESLNTYELSAVRPVINIDKCAVDGGCYEEEIKVATGCIDDNTNNNVVNVPSTLKNISITILIICGILVASGIGIIIFNYIRARKERK